MVGSRNPPAQTDILCNVRVQSDIRTHSYWARQGASTRPKSNMSRLRPTTRVRAINIHRTVNHCAPGVAREQVLPQCHGKSLFIDAKNH